MSELEANLPYLNGLDVKGYGAHLLTNEGLIVFHLSTGQFLCLTSAGTLTWNRDPYHAHVFLSQEEFRTVYKQDHDMKDFRFFRHTVFSDLPKGEPCTISDPSAPSMESQSTSPASP